MTKYVASLRCPIAVVIIITIVVGLCLIIFIPMLATTMTPSSDSVSLRNLSRIRHAILCYHQDYGSFPVAGQDIVTNKPLHSWRVLLLPYLGQERLYAAYNFAEPWNSPSNLKLGQQIPVPYMMPMSRIGAYTTYHRIVGPKTVWGRSLQLEVRFDETRGRFVFAPVSWESALLVVDLSSLPTHWMSPDDPLSIENATELIEVNGLLKRVPSLYYPEDAPIHFGIRLDDSVSLIYGGTIESVVADELQVR